MIIVYNTVYDLMFILEASCTFPTGISLTQVGSYFSEVIRFEKAGFHTHTHTHTQQQGTLYTIT